MPRQEMSLTGRQFSRLFVLGEAAPRFYGSKRQRRFMCLCDCGNAVIVSHSGLATGHAKSCGCYGREKAADRCRRLKVTHGEGGHGRETVEYRAWQSIKTRCCVPTDYHYKWYGARGITMCAEWQQSYPAFLAHVGRKPRPEYSLDRIDNNKGYEPGNVRWATQTQQTRNSRKAIIIEFDGERRCLTEWAEKIGINVITLKKYLRRGESIREIQARFSKSERRDDLKSESPQVIESEIEYVGPRFSLVK